MQDFLMILACHLARPAFPKCIFGKSHEDEELELQVLKDMAVVAR